MKRTLTRTLVLAAASSMAITLSACGAEDAASDAADSAGSAASSASEEATGSDPSSAAPSSSAMPMDDAPFGPACSQVPTEGEGSVEGMSDDPVATAASNNPLLSTLVTAVTQANLVDTLNSAQDITVIAPANPAFEALPPGTLDTVLADNAQLTGILTHHVLQGRLSPEQLAGEQTDINGDPVTITGSGEMFTIEGTVTGTPASVICGNVQTANATVYVVDQVLAPPAA